MENIFLILFVIIYNILTVGRLHYWGSLPLKQSIIVVIGADLVFIPLYILIETQKIEISDKTFYIILIILGILSLIAIEYFSRNYPADCSVVLGKLKHALSAGRLATRFAGSAMLEMLCEMGELFLF
jgi:hypothetical protein